jgi:hypothetical protein
MKVRVHGPNLICNWCTDLDTQTMLCEVYFVNGDYASWYLCQACRQVLEKACESEARSIAQEDGVLVTKETPS